MSIEALRSRLAQLEPGLIADPSEILTLLEECWDEFEGSGEQAMHAGKLSRAEDVFWKPPYLSFDIERHGATVLGSTRADLQRWRVNLDSLSAECGKISHRQIYPMQPRMKVEPIAEELIGLIIRGEKDPRLEWQGPTQVRILIGKVIPSSGFRQTFEGRRRRLKGVLEDGLRAAAWIPVQHTRPNTWRRLQQ